MDTLVGSEENGYPVPDPNKTVINVSNEPSDTHKNPSMGKSWKKSQRNPWRRYQTWLMTKYKRYTRNFNTPQIKNLRKQRNN
jgi:hypothetical protein